MISINLAVVNFLPIPVLDGGHAVLLIAEKIRGKPLSEKVLYIATLCGLAFVVCLMLFVTFMDLTRFTWFQKLFGW
jgi:regulator of sigma E protease